MAAVYEVGESFNAINIFAPGATGNVVPVQSITGGSTDLDDLWGVAIH